MDLYVIDKKNKHKCNCVTYARSRVPSLPYGSWTLEDKKKTINSKEPMVGAVATTKDGVWYNRWGRRVFSGHVAVVTKIDGRLITIQEANFRKCAITERTGTEEELKIIGYYIPGGVIQPDYKKLYDSEREDNKKLRKRLDDIREIVSQKTFQPKIRGLVKPQFRQQIACFGSKKTEWLPRYLENL